MLLSFKNKKTNQVAEAIQTGRAAAADYLPYYCHYNPHTLLTKNGELMQTIKICKNLNGLDYESGADMFSSVREHIRQAVLEEVRTDKIAIWIHTVRKRKPIHYRGKFKEGFATSLHERWQKLHKWKFQYYNEIYVTLLTDGQSSMLLDTVNFKQIVLPKRNREFRNAYLDVMAEELDRTVQNMITRIRRTFDARRLSVMERISKMPELRNQAVFYSEPMEFLGQLLNLREQEFPVPELDVSDALCTTMQTFGFNAVETKTLNGKKRFGGLLTLKQYREIPPETADHLLQKPIEFVITQAFHYIPHSGALKPYKDQKDLLDVSGDDYCIQGSGLADMIASHAERHTDFGEHQTSIMVLADEFKQLDSEIIKVQAALADLGLITIREDLKLEECFWAQLPGNFEFIRRRDTINTIRIGGFCRLNRFPNGNDTNNHWGDAVTLLPTQVGSPYFFNFHHQDNGHTLVYDCNSFNDQVCPILMNFLLSETRKFDGRLYVFDRNRSAYLMTQKLGGKYHNFTALTPPLTRDPNQPQMRLNPFSLEDSSRNKGFLLAWCSELLGPDMKPTEEQKVHLRTAIDQLFAGPAERRNVPGLLHYLNPLDAALAKKFARWTSEGAFGGIFDHGEESFSLEDALHAFDMSPVLKHPDVVVPVFAYLLHRIVTAIDGRPTIIVLYEAWDLIENSFIAPRIESLMEMLQQNNAMIIFTTSRPQQVIPLRSFAAVSKLCATRLYIPDDIGRDYLAEGYHLTERDSKMLLRMDRQKGDFLIKQSSETIALCADLRQLDDLYVILSNDVKNLAAALGKYDKKDDED